MDAPLSAALEGGPGSRPPSPFAPGLRFAVRAARLPLALAVLSDVGLTATTVAQAALLAEIIAGAFIGSRQLPSLLTPLCLLAGVTSLRAALSWSLQVSSRRAAQVAKSRLRRRLVEALVAVGPTWERSHRSGELALLAGPGMEALDAYFGRYLPQLVATCASIALLLAFVATWDWPSAAILGGALLLLPLFMVLLGLEAQSQARARWDALSELGARFLDLVQGLPTLRVFGVEEAQAGSIAASGERLRRMTLDTLRVALLSAFALELLAALGTAGVAVGLGLRLLSGGTSLATALAVLILAPEVFVPLRRAATQFHASTAGFGAAAAVEEVLEAEPALPRVGELRPAEKPVLDLKEVCIFVPERPVAALQPVSLHLRPGDHVALTGPSGAGKTSLLELILGFRQPSRGGIEVDGVPLSELDQEGWRERLSWLPQQPHLVAGSVLDNLRLGRPEASLAEVQAATDAAGATELIQLLPNGLQTEVGERGLTLSPGECQLLALARALLRPAPILLLDEPSSHLDAEHEAHLAHTLRTGLGSRTVLLATHRRALVEAMERNLELVPGEVA